MSVRNIFWIKTKNDISIKTIYAELEAFMVNSRFGIVFEPQGYYDVFLEKIKCENNFFTLTENKTVIECEDIFSIYEAYEYAKAFHRREFDSRMREFMYNKLSFMDELIKIVFGYEDVESIEVYISDQYSEMLEDYARTVTVCNGEFVKALLEVYKPIKGDRVYGLKTAKYIIYR